MTFWLSNWPIFWLSNWLTTLLLTLTHQLTDCQSDFYTKLNLRKPRMDSYDQISILLLKHTKLKRFKHAKTTAPTICNHRILGDILRPESPLYKHKLLSKDENLWVKQQAENMIDFEFTIYMPWQTFLESLVTLPLNVDGQRRYTTLWRAGTTVKVTMISLKTIPVLFLVLSRVWNKSIITMVLKKSNIAVTVYPGKCKEIA